MNQYRFRERLEHGDQARPWHLYTLFAVEGNVFPCHWHPEWELLIVEQGTLSITRNQRVENLDPGQVVFLTGTELHGGTSTDRDLRCRALVFHPGLLRSEHRDAATELWVEPLEAGTFSVPEVLPAGSPAASLAAKTIEAIVRDTPGTELAVKGLLFQFLAEIAASGLVQRCSEPVTSDPIRQIRSVLQLIEERFPEPLTVEALAVKAGYSPSYFARVFRAVTGDTPINHLIRRRIEEAARLLRQEHLSVSEAAQKVGFTNFSHFTRTFRAWQGVNPSKAVRR